MYVYLMKNIKPLNKDIIERHVKHLRKLRSEDRLILCGPFKDYPGGMVVIMAKDLVEATSIANSDPFIASGFKTFEIRELEVANEDNNYLLA